LENHQNLTDHFVNSELKIH